MRTLVDEGIGAFIVVWHEHSLVGLGVLFFWEPPWSVIYGILSLWESLCIWWSVGRKLFHDAWVASKYLINVVNLKRSPSSNLVISWRRQPTKGVSLLETSTFWELFKASHGQWRTDGSLADAAFPSASTVAVALCGRRSTLFCPHISCPLLHNSVGYKLTVLWSIVELPFWA